MKRIFIFFWLVLFPLFSWGDCSPYMGMATINEVSKFRSNGNDHVEDLVEIKILDESIPQAVYSSWDIRICENSGDGCTGYISLSSFDNVTPPWLVLKGDPLPAEHISFDDSFDLIFRDQNGLTIDYLTYDGHQPQLDNNCFAQLPFDTASGKSGGGEKRIRRQPDGIGGWNFVTAQSIGDTEDDTNDDVPADAPSVSISDATVSPGQVAIFTVSLDAAFTEDVVLTYSTLDGTAQAGSDYVTTNGTITILAGSTTADFPISTLVNGSGIFNVVLGLDISAANYPNAVLGDQVGLGILSGGAIANWKMNEGDWAGDGSTADVVDSSGNGYNGISALGIENNGEPPDFDDAAIPGEEGTCYFADFGDYSLFDFNAERIQVSSDFGGAGNAFGELTLMAWVKVYDTGINLFDDYLFRKGGEFDLVVTRDEFFTQGDFLEFRWRNGSETFRSNARLGLGGWVHIALVFKPGEQRFYFNGSLDSNVGNNTLGLQNDASFLYLGSDEGGGFNQLYGLMDEVRIYDAALPISSIQAIMQETTPCEIEVDHYAISHSGTGVTCEGSTITITAHDENDDEVSPPVDTVITPEAYISGGALSDDAVWTPANYTFSGDEADVSATFVLTQVEPALIDIDVSDGTITDLDDGGAEDPILTFTDTVFRFYADDNADGDRDGTNRITSPLIAGQTYIQYILQAIKTDDETGACIPAITNGPQSVEMGYQCENPLTCAGSNKFSVSNLPIPGNSFGVTTNTATVNLSFDTDGEAAFSARFDDVGQIRLFAELDLPAQGDDPAYTIEGSSDHVIVKPFGFYVYAYKDGMPVINNPGAQNASGDVFIGAGQDFTVSATTVLWQAEDDLDNNGVPDNLADGDPTNNANLSNNSVAENFGNEIVPATITLSSSLYEPSGGIDPSLSGIAVINSFTNGEGFSDQVRFDEVGIIEINSVITGSNYLGEGDTSGEAGLVGRFTPAYLEIFDDDEIGFSTDSLTLQGLVQNSCGSFTYLGQPFQLRYDVVAKNSLGSITENYRNGFAKLDGSNSNTFAFSASNNSVLDDNGTVADNSDDTLRSQDNLSGRLTYSAGDTISDWERDYDSDGTIDYGYGRLTSTLVFSRDASEDILAPNNNSPYQNVRFGVFPADSDSVTVRSSDYDYDLLYVAPTFVGETKLVNRVGADFRFGRLWLSDAHGPESTDLRVPFITEYWTGSRFVQNLVDGCTVISRTEISFNGSTIDDNANRTVDLGGGNSTFGSYDINYDVSDGESHIDLNEVSFTAGTSFHFFTAPGVTGNVLVDVDLTDLDWLRFDWDGDGDYDNDTSLPTATINFQTYRGHDRIIYWRERY